jgi:hypothetical protein
MVTAHAALSPSSFLMSIAAARCWPPRILPDPRRDECMPCHVDHGHGQVARRHSLKGPKAQAGILPDGRVQTPAEERFRRLTLGGRSRRRAPPRESFQMTHNRSFKAPVPIPNFGHSFIAEPKVCAPISSRPRRRQGGLTNRQPSVVSFKFQLSESSSAMILPASAKAVFAAGTPA